MRLKCRFPGVGQLTQCGGAKLCVEAAMESSVAVPVRGLLGIQMGPSNEMSHNDTDIRGIAWLCVRHGFLKPRKAYR